MSPVVVSAVSPDCARAGEPPAFPALGAVASSSEITGPGATADDMADVGFETETIGVAATLATATPGAEWDG